MDFCNYTQHSWNTFVIANIEPNDVDFFKKDYIITWEDNPIGNQHGGYYLNYNNRFDAPSDMFIRDGGPTWWWYSDLTSDSQQWQLGQNFDIMSANLAFRKLHRMIFRFVDNTTWSVTHTYDGLTYTNILSTYDGWTFSDKRSIQLFRKEIGIMSSSSSLLSVLNIRDNILLPLIIHDENIGNSNFEYIISMLNLKNLLDKTSADLSSGERQRVLLARAMVLKPKILIADEPTANLDLYNSKRLVNFLRYLNDELKTTIIVATHDDIVSNISKRVYELEK